MLKTQICVTCPKCVKIFSSYPQHKRSNFWTIQCRVSNFCKAAAPWRERKPSSLNIWGDETQKHDCEGEYFGVSFKHCLSTDGSMWTEREVTERRNLHSEVLHNFRTKHLTVKKKKGGRTCLKNGVNCVTKFQEEITRGSTSNSYAWMGGQYNNKYFAF